MKRQTYRGVEFVVNSSDGDEWTWDAYPIKKIVDGSPIHGTVKGTEKDAIKACQTAIDEQFEGQQS